MIRAFVLFACSIVAAASASAQGLQPPASSQQPGAPSNVSSDPNAAKGSSTIRGHVTAADTGRPLRQAQVRLLAIDVPNGGTRENRVASTDADGSFEFKELFAGRYNLTATKAGYVSISFGQVQPRDASRPIDLLAAQTLERVDFVLRRGSVIAGRVVDEYGEPLSNVQVMALTPLNGRTLPSGHVAMTDDLGNFRIYGLSPGQYYIQGVLRNNSGGPPEPDRTGYANTYFPGVLEQSGAQRFALGASQSISDVTFAMIPVKLVSVTGAATDSHGKPMSGMISMTSTAAAGPLVANGAPLRPDGTFTFPNVTPGEYTLRVQAPAADSEFAMTTLTVGDQNLTGVQLTASPRPTATGRLVVDPAAGQALASATLAVVASFAQPVAMMGPIAPGRVSDDGTFTMKALPGRLNMFVTGLPPGYGVRAVRAAGLDVTDTGVEFRPGADVKDIEIEVTNQLTTVTGLVTTAQSVAATDYTAIVYSQEPERWKPGSRYVKIARADQDGRFKVTGLPPGDYYAIALDRIDTATWNDPDTLQALRQDATSFSLMEGETKTLDLRLRTPR